VRLALLLALSAGCGRFEFDAIAPADAVPALDLACGETVTTRASPIAGRTLKVVATKNRLVALWLDAAGALFGTTWTSTSEGAVVTRDAVAMDAGPYTQLWAAASDDSLAVAVSGDSGVTALFLRDDLTVSHVAWPMGPMAQLGRHPVTRASPAPGFVMSITLSSDLGVFELPTEAPATYVFPERRSHVLPSIAADASSYAIVTELAEPTGSSCWYSWMHLALSLEKMPAVPLGTTQQVACDSVSVASSAGPHGAGIVWLEHDPANTYVQFRGTGSGGGTASMAGELGVKSPSITATPDGFALLYWSLAGLRVFDGAGTRTLTDSALLADLVTWDERALVVWTTSSGAPRLTRLCPSS
jgi:hypothetical protein